MLQAYKERAASLSNIQEKQAPFFLSEGWGRGMQGLKPDMLKHKSCGKGILSFEGNCKIYTECAVKKRALGAYILFYEQ